MTSRNRCQLLQVNQWLKTWELANWSNGRQRPPAQFYIGSISLKALRGLSGVRPRTKEDRKEGSAGTGYQRTHDKDRLSKIGRYVEYGFPLSSEGRLDPAQHRELINPGWLPTAILVNVLAPNQSRPRKGKDRFVEAEHLVSLVEESGSTYLDYPSGVQVDQEKQLPPLEIIDGQHRLLASDTVQELPDDYQVPIVVFYDLPLAWQAYLFWVINVEPKRINTSLAFDLYPDLRDQDWLQRGESVKIYQEHRSQELTEVLWKHPQSPWHDRIELFGNRIDGHVSNAAAIRSLMTTFVRPWGKKSEEAEEITRLGGLFGSIDRGGKTYIVRWRRPEQAAFLLLVWTAVRNAISQSKAEWKTSLESELKKKSTVTPDFAFSGSHTLLGTDQGFRAVSFAFNALAQIRHEEIGLLELESQDGDSEPSDESVSLALSSLSKIRPLSQFLADVASSLAVGVDWRTSSAPGLDTDTKARQAQYRGSSGYSALNRATMLAAERSSSPLVAAAARDVLKLQGWN